MQNFCIFSKIKTDGKLSVLHQQLQQPFTSLCISSKTSCSWEKPEHSSSPPSPWPCHLCSCIILLVALETEKTILPRKFAIASTVMLMFATLTALLYHEKTERKVKNKRVINLLNGQHTVTSSRVPGALKVSAVRDLRDIPLHKRLQAATECSPAE